MTYFALQFNVFFPAHDPTAAAAFSAALALAGLADKTGMSPLAKAIFAAWSSSSTSIAAPPVVAFVSKPVVVFQTPVRSPAYLK